MTEKETYFIVIESEGKRGIGECGLLRGLSIDDRPDYEEKLQWVCDAISRGETGLWESLMEFPSIQFGYETAMISLIADDPFLLFPSDFTRGEKNIPINGLVWMGEPDFMQRQIEEKLASGFHCIKLKIGAIDFEAELDLLRSIRDRFDTKTIEVRVDANGAFSATDAAEKIHRLSRFGIHSIEQPIKPNQIEAMAQLCTETPIPIALDEELIGVFAMSDKENLLQRIQPQYIILKPSLVGGFLGCEQWIHAAEKLGIGWWITSTLESNVGLNAIAQWTYLQQNPMPQGLGTGALYTNNFESPLTVSGGSLWYDVATPWHVNL